MTPLQEAIARFPNWIDHGERYDELIDDTRLILTAEEAEGLRAALTDLLAAVEADVRTKRGDFYHERKAARALTRREDGGKT